MKATEAEVVITMQRRKKRISSKFPFLIISFDSKATFQKKLKRRRRRGRNGRRRRRKKKTTFVRAELLYFVVFGAYST